MIPAYSRITRLRLEIADIVEELQFPIYDTHAVELLHAQLCVKRREIERLEAGIEDHFANIRKGEI